MVLVEYTDRQLAEVSRDELYELIGSGNISAVLVNDTWLEIRRSGKRGDGTPGDGGSSAWPNLFSPAQLSEQIQLLKQQLKEQEAVIKELKRLLAESEALQGIITICANCKKIRDDREEWVSPDKFIETHARVKFSHGICRDCVAKLYPESFMPEL